MALSFAHVYITVYIVYSLILTPIVPSNAISYLTDILDEINDDKLRNITIAWASICPAIMMCNSFINTENVTLNEQYSIDDCCISCSCNAFCHKSNSCCAHVKGKDIVNTGKYFKYSSCMDTYKYVSENERTVLEAKGYGLNDNGFIFVTTCPEYNATEQKDLCEYHVEDDTRSLFDMVPVTSDGMHFTNRYCAACHGIAIENIVKWDVQIRYCITIYYHILNF